jgi:hypothetical protein
MRLAAQANGWGKGREEEGAYEGMGLPLLRASTPAACAPAPAPSLRSATVH